MIKPVNGHLLIEPVAHETFMVSQNEKYEEIGVVVDFDQSSGFLENLDEDELLIGDRVYFDAWLAAKYPKNETEFYWLVKWEDVRAVDHEEIPKQ